MLVNRTPFSGHRFTFPPLQQRATESTAAATCKPVPDAKFTIPKALQAAATKAVTAAGVPKSWATNKSLWQLLWHESTLNPKAQNPTSTAFGLFQFLDSTWGKVGATKTSDPLKQFVAGYKYIKASYGTPEKAWAFWKSQCPHWYLTLPGN